jgi:hypothetical protein
LISVKIYNQYADQQGIKGIAIFPLIIGRPMAAKDSNEETISTDGVLYIHFHETLIVLKEAKFLSQ